MKTKIKIILKAILNFIGKFLMTILHIIQLVIKSYAYCLRKYTKDTVYITAIVILIAVIILQPVMAGNEKFESKQSDQVSIQVEQDVNENVNPDFTIEAMNLALADAQRYGANYEMLSSFSYLWEKAKEYDVNPLMMYSIMYHETKVGTLGSGTAPRYNPYGIGNNENPEHLGGYNGAHDRALKLISQYYIGNGLDSIDKIGKVYCPISPIQANGHSAWVNSVSAKYNALHSQL